MILDETGELVWFRPLRGNDQAFDFRAQTYRGEPVLTWWQGRMQLYRGGGVGRIVDTRYRPVATVRAGNGYAMDAHELKLTPAGTALTMSYFVVPWDLTKLGGRRDGLVEDNVVQEIDVETGAVLFEWHTLGSIPLGESYRPAPKERGKIHDPWHLNSVELDRDGDFVRVGAPHERDLQDRPRDRAGRVAARWQAQQLRDGARDQVRAPARRARPARRDADAVRQRRRGPARARPRVARDRARARPREQHGVAGARVRAPGQDPVGDAGLDAGARGRRRVRRLGRAAPAVHGVRQRRASRSSTRASGRRGSRPTAPTGCRGGRAASDGRGRPRATPGGRRS